MALRIENGRRVELAYRLTDTDGRLLEDRTPETPFEYVHGSGQVLEAVERLVEGKTAGFQGEIQLSAREAYGVYDPNLETEIPLSQFPKGSEVSVGMKFNTVGPKGQPLTVRVIEVEDDMVSVDGNHPLAGLDLVFDVRVLSVREGQTEKTESDVVPKLTVKTVKGSRGSDGLH